MSDSSAVPHPCFSLQAEVLTHFTEWDEGAVRLVDMVWSKIISMTGMPNLFKDAADIMEVIGPYVDQFRSEIFACNSLEDLSKLRDSICDKCPFLKTFVLYLPDHQLPAFYECFIALAHCQRIYEKSKIQSTSGKPTPPAPENTLYKTDPSTENFEKN